VIARKELLPAYQQWNRKWGAPFGSPVYRLSAYLPRGRPTLDKFIFKPFPRLQGYFGFQPNNTIRSFEYPWAFHATPIRQGLRVLEIGGGLSGFQFVLSRLGCDVVNVDPGMDARGRGWPVDQVSMTRLNRAFRTSVMLHRTFLNDAPLEEGTFDRVFSISVLEHVPADEMPGIVKRAYNLLKPGGMLVVTVDLFLNLTPFCSRLTNEYGSNVSMRMLATGEPFEFVSGDRRELYGFTEFDKDAILGQLEDFMVGGDYPALAQLMVLKKPDAP
jgi:SAM-dependent methyltransferase